MSRKRDILEKYVKIEQKKEDREVEEKNDRG